MAIFNADGTRTDGTGTRRIETFTTGEADVIGSISEVQIGTPGYGPIVHELSFTTGGDHRKAYTVRLDAEALMQALLDITTRK